MGAGALGRHVSRRGPRVAADHRVVCGSRRRRRRPGGAVVARSVPDVPQGEPAQPGAQADGVGPADPGARGRPCTGADAGDGQAAGGGARRAAVRARVHVVVCGRGGANPRQRQRAIDAGPARARGQAADWRVRGPGAVELSDCDDPSQGGRRAGGRVHDNRQAVTGDAADVPDAGPAGAAGGLRARGVQRGDDVQRAHAGARRGAVHAPARQQGDLYGLDGRGQPGGRPLRQGPQEAHHGAGRQLSLSRLCRRRPGAGPRPAAGPQVAPRRPGLHHGQPRLRGGAHLRRLCGQAGRRHRPDPRRPRHRRRHHHGPRHDGPRPRQDPPAARRRRGPGRHRCRGRPHRRRPGPRPRLLPRAHRAARRAGDRPHRQRGDVRPRAGRLRLPDRGRGRAAGQRHQHGPRQLRLHQERRPRVAPAGEPRGRHDWHEHGQQLRRRVALWRHEAVGLWQGVGQRRGRRRVSRVQDGHLYGSGPLLAGISGMPVNRLRTDPAAKNVKMPYKFFDLIVHKDKTSRNGSLADERR